MRIAIYSSPIHSIAKPTGVGRHIASMAAELAQHAGVEPTLLTTRGSYEAVRPYLSEPLSSMPVRYLPGSERWMRMLLVGTRLAGVERWSGEVDWIYSPKEQPITTRRTRLAVTVHDVLPFENGVNGINTASRRSRARWRLTMNRILSRADLIATVSEFTKSRMLELLDGVREERIAVIGNGVAPAFFREAEHHDHQVLEAYGVSPRRYVVAVGSLTHRKNGPALLRLAERLHAEGAGLQILVAGRRHDQQLVDQLAAITAEKPDFPVRLLGYVADEDLAALLSHAVAMLFPSRYEGFGIPVLEAMAAGAPVIASRAAALPEVVGGAGIEIDGDDETAMFESLQRLIDDAALRSDLVERGRQRAADFTWPRCAERLIDAMRARG